MSEARPVFCVMGAGHGGVAMAGYLALKGFRVHLFNRSAARIESIRARGGVEIEGEELYGYAEIPLITTDAGEAMEGADVIMIVVPASAHEDLARLCAPHLKKTQMVILNPGRTLGAIAFLQELRRQRAECAGIIAETQTFIFASRVTGPAQARIFRIKNSVPLATVRAHRIARCLAVVRAAFPQFVPGDNVFKTSFGNVGMIFHPGIVLLNAGWVENPADFEFYHEGVTRSVARALEAADAERVAVSAALGWQTPSAREWLYLAYASAGKDLYDAMHANPGYRGIDAPKRTEMRYVTEDVPCGLVPMCSLGKRFGVPTPVMSAWVTLASTMHGRDYQAEGRTLERLGLADLDIKGIRRLAIGQEEAA